MNIVLSGNENLFLQQIGNLLVSSTGIICGIVYVTSIIKVNPISHQVQKSSIDMITSTESSFSRNTTSATKNTNSTGNSGTTNLAISALVAREDSDLLNRALITDYDNYSTDELYLTFSP
jgi:hypothetical protein